LLLCYCLAPITFDSPYFCLVFNHFIDCPEGNVFFKHDILLYSVPLQISLILDKPIPGQSTFSSPKFK